MCDYSKKRRLFSAFIVLLGLLPYRWIIENTLVPDRHLESVFAVIAISLLQLSLVSLGLAVLLFSELAGKMRTTFLRVKQFSSLRRFRKWPLSTTLILLVTCALYGSWAYTSQPLFEVVHFPDRFTLREGDFTANIHGLRSRFAENMVYKLNDESWKAVVSGKPRVTEPQFIIELTDDELLSGENTLAIKAEAFGRETQFDSHHFIYDDKEPTLPITRDWTNPDLEIDDGIWEIAAFDSERRVRPRPGYESYDRIFVITGAFAGGRRIETDVIFRRQMAGTNNYGFGLLPLWGGHPDDASLARPRRGWLCSIAWFYDLYQSVGNEFSYKIGDNEPVFSTSYSSLSPEPNIKYRVVVEVWPVRDELGRHLYFKQRMKWWVDGETEPENWIELADTQGAALPPIKYGVALLAYHSQVDFGPVKISAIADQTVQTELELQSKLNEIDGTRNTGF